MSNKITKETQTSGAKKMSRVESMGAKVEMSYVTAVGTTWRELRWLSQDRSGWWKFVCAYIYRELAGGVMLVI